jgi:hypothetical protein
VVSQEEDIKVGEEVVVVVETTIKEVDTLAAAAVVVEATVGKPLAGSSFLPMAVVTAIPVDSIIPKDDFDGITCFCSVCVQ